MPYLYWHENGYQVETQWKKSNEKTFEHEAQTVDRMVDSIFDNALSRLNTYKINFLDYKKHKEFYRDYAVGSSIIESEILNHEYLKGDGTVEKPPELLDDIGNFKMVMEKGVNVSFFTAIGKKASLGKSLEFSDSKKWMDLRPSRSDAVNKGKKRDNGKKDIYARAIYLAEQELEKAKLTFGGRIDLVSGSFERNWNSLKLRDAIAEFYNQFEEQSREKLYSRDNNRAMYKKLNQVFPSTGPGSTKNPDVYSELELLEMLNSIWAEFNQ